MSFAARRRALPLLALSIAPLLLATAALAQTVTIRDSNGRIVGTRTTDSTGLVTIRDANGTVIGTEHTDTTGTTTLRDGRGTVTGTRR
jgi:hypothetical protein